MSFNRSSFILDLLPNEILHSIFDFLWSEDILFAFLRISNYIDGVIYSYDSYHVNFKAIVKRNFDLICHHIKPSQIKSLVLSDSKETPGQSKIYLSLFPIEKFVRLRAICLLEIEDDSRSLFVNINQLKRLISFETNILSNLWIYDLISFSHLRLLKLPYCSYTQLRQILSDAPKLTTLNISLFISDCTGIDYFAEQHQDPILSIHHLTMSICTFSKLRYLKLIFFSRFFFARTISRLLFERFLSRMQHLRQLELIVSSGGSVNLLEGNQWELFITQYLPLLSRFNFKFKLIPIDRQTYNENHVLAAFRTPFWLERNPAWYVGYNLDDLILYTIPYFVPRTIKHSLFSNAAKSTTLPVEQYSIYYNQINELELDSNCKSSYRCTHIQRLILSVTTFDESVIDLSKVEYLCVKSPSYPLKKLFQIIQKSMTRLYHLEIQFNISTIQLRDVVPLEQIRTLHLLQVSDSLHIDLSLLFPCVEYLTIELNNLHQMVHLIDRLRHLSSASFRLTHHSAAEFTEPNRVRQCLREKTNRLARDNNFTCRVDADSDVWIHLWISNEGAPSKKLSSAMLTHRETDCQCGCSLQ